MHVHICTDSPCFPVLMEACSGLNLGTFNASGTTVWMPPSVLRARGVCCCDAGTIACKCMHTCTCSSDGLLCLRNVCPLLVWLERGADKLALSPFVSHLSSKPPGAKRVVFLFCCRGECGCNCLTWDPAGGHKEVSAAAQPCMKGTTPRSSGQGVLVGL